MHDEDDYVVRFFSDPSYRKQASEHLANCMKEREQVQALEGVLDQSEEMATILLSCGLPALRSMFHAQTHPRTLCMCLCSSESTHLTH